MLDNFSKSIILFSLLFSCACSTYPYRNETTLLGDFLQENFKVEIRSDSVKYIFISNYNCKNCVKGTLGRLQNTDSIPIILIASKGYDLKDQIKIKVEQIFIDSLNNIDLMSFSSGGLTEVIVFNKKIVEIRNLSN